MRASIKLKADFKELMKSEVRLSRKKGVDFIEMVNEVNKHNPKGNQIEMLRKLWSLQAIEEVIKEETVKTLALGRNNNSESIADTLFRLIKD